MSNRSDTGASMKLSQLRNLVAVAEAGSVRQAARNLNVSQSAVTKSIQQLEDNLGVELLHRVSHGVTPTAAGQALVSRAKIIGAELRQARNDIESVQGGASGEIRVSASPTVALGLLPAAVTEFKKSRPKVHFQIEEGLFPEVLPGVRKGEIDFAICLVPERPREEELNFELLVRDRLIPAVRPQHPLTQRTDLTLKDLRDEEWVSYRRRQSSRDIFEMTFVQNDLEPPENVTKCTSFAFILALVENSNCITLVPKKMFSAKVRGGAITPLLMETPMPSWNVMVISRARHVLSPLCRDFLSELRAIAARSDTAAVAPKRS